MTEDEHALGCLETYLSYVRERKLGTLGVYTSWAEDDVPYLQRCVEMVRAYVEGQA